MFLYKNQRRGLLEVFCLEVQILCNNLDEVLSELIFSPK